ncbi:unnamed protein product [Anisakis simplex]|uniref:Fbw5 (inferred by orthology to a D. melanogaster protein) n=1 Tax=Anisakis simplex TaxID=6269 RepID=A0A0M3J649_ANISI|nr:unnamed protein product [Anisakis simplex]
MTATWGELPTEILISIMSYLDAKELARMGNVNYHWKRVCEDDSLWRPLLIRDYLLPRDTNLKVYDRWVDEYKLLKFDSPINLSENLRDCPQGITNVAFSPDGKLFCTTANDGSFKIWTATRPTYLIHERYLDESLGWERALFSKFSADSKSLLVSGIKQNQNGEIAVFTIDGTFANHIFEYFLPDERTITIDSNSVDAFKEQIRAIFAADEAEVHFSSRVKNNPADVNACWYNNSHLIISDLFTFNHNLLFSSIIGSSISLLWICSGASALNETNESVLKPLLRIPNQRGGYCQMFEIAQYIPTRLRSVVYLSRQAALEKTVLTIF